MSNKKDILSELKMISPTLAGIEKINVFSVPGNYFDHLSQLLLISIKKEDQFSVRYFNKSAMGNSVPSGYFDSLADNILNKIQQHNNALEEIKQLSPLLYQLQPINVFRIPDNYFDNINHRQIIYSQSKQIAKVVNIRKSIFKYAVAATITGIIAVGFFKFTSNNPASNASLPQYVLDGEKIIDIDKELEKMNDTEIVSYLQANGEGVDASLLANVIDEADLPSETDYFMDEQTLDNYLNDMDDKNDLKN